MSSAPEINKQKIEIPVPATSEMQTPAFGWPGAAPIWMRFERYRWDILGLLFVTLAVLTWLGLQGLSDGSLITPWVNFIKRWLGFGSYLVVIFCISLGFEALRQPLGKPPGLKLGRTLILEFWAFCLLAFLSSLGGNLLERANQGLDGGVIGWGLANLIGMALPTPWSTILLALLVVILPFIGLGILQYAGRKFEKWVMAARPESGEEDSPASGADLKRTADVPDEKKRSTAEEPAVLSQKSASAPNQKRDKRLPPLNLLLEEQTNLLDKNHIHNTAMLIEKTLAEFGIPSRVVGFRVGPTVTQFAVEPGYIEKTAPDGSITQHKIRISQISSLSRDLARALSAEQLRIEAPVPGHSFVGIEAPNPKSTTVRLRPLLESETFRKAGAPLAVVLGRNVSGQPVVADLARMPHMLIAGTTGSGKSVCIQALTTCLIANNSPEDLRLAMIDPKMVELVRFNGLPHLFGQVETKLERMIGVLRWAIVEMENRYRLLEGARTRDLEAYNRRMRRRNEKTLPRIVLLVDELADLMMTAPDQTEHSLVRLAQMARATGIHLIVATQRPSTDVITGLIKANFPSRVAFSVASSVDSRVILDTNGAENLLGHGDMLFLNPEIGSPIRAQGVMISDEEIKNIVDFWKETQTPDESQVQAPWEALLDSDSDDSDNLLDQAIAIVRKAQRASASLLQRRLRIGYPRAARLIDELESMNIIGPSMGSGKEREVYLSPSDEDDPDNLDY